MGEQPRICFYCDKLLGCKHLSDTYGSFVPERAVTPANFWDCSDWAPIRSLQKNVREDLYSIQGEGCLRILHQMNNMIMQDVKREEEENDMIGDVPDFAKMLRAGMTVEERERQLRYETDDAGDVLLDEEGNARPRPAYVTKKFACDQNGHIKLDHSQGMFWKIEDVVKYILDEETKQGLIVKTKKTAEQAKPKETDMAGERRVIINRKPNIQSAEPPAEVQAPPPGPKPMIGAVKIGAPPRRITPGAVAVAPVEAQEPVAEETSCQGISKEDINLAVSDAIALSVVPKINELMSSVVAIRHDLEELYEKLLSSITILHDSMCQTEGHMKFQDEEGNWKPLDCKFGKANKILDYVDPQE